MPAWANPWVRYVTVALAAAALGVAAGRYLTPPKVVTKVERVVEVQVREVVKEVRVAAKARDTVRRTRTTTTPDGATTTETEVHRTERSDTTTRTDVATEARGTEAVAATKIVTAPSSWGINTLVGVGGIGAQITPAVGVQVTGRVWGPVRLGAWGLYEVGAGRGAAGASVGVEF